MRGVMVAASFSLRHPSSSIMRPAAAAETSGCAAPRFWAAAPAKVIQLIVSRCPGTIREAPLPPSAAQNRTSFREVPCSPTYS